MTVTPIEGEIGRFWVTSETRQDVVHVVDLRGKPDRCSCEQAQAKGDRYCKHLKAVIKHLTTYGTSQLCND